MVEATPITPSPSAQPAPSPSAAAPAAGGGSPTPTNNAPVGEVVRPDYLPEAFWDAEKKAPKADDLKTLAERAAADDQRKASLPKTADEYKAELPKDFQLPENWEIKGDHPMWAAGREFALKKGMSQEDFSDLAAMYVGQQVADGKALAEAAKARDASLGANGGARVEALNTWFRGLFGDQVAGQFANTLFTKDIVEGFERVQAALTSQGVTSFSNTGREEGRRDGKPANWDQMSAIDRRTHQLIEQQRAAGGR